MATAALLLVGVVSDYTFLVAPCLAQNSGDFTTKKTLSTRSQEKMSKTVFLATLFIIIIFALGFLAFFYGVLSRPNRNLKKTEVVIGKATFNVEVASTTIARARGLSGREGLGDNEGLLFLFGGFNNYGFWMKDMKFPIDIIWIRACPETPYSASTTIFSAASSSSLLDVSTDTTSSSFGAFAQKSRHVATKEGFRTCSGDRVVGFAENAASEPGRALWNLKIYYPPEPIDKVLEVNAGTVKKFGIKAGDSVEFSEP